MHRGNQGHCRDTESIEAYLMEKIVEEKRIKSYFTHTFYCDDCEKFLLESIEHEDGYYKEPDTFYIQHVKLKGHYCEACGMKRVNDVISYARNRGFEI